MAHPEGHGHVVDSLKQINAFLNSSCSAFLWLGIWFVSLGKCPAICLACRRTRVCLSLYVSVKPTDQVKDEAYLRIATHHEFEKSSYVLYVWA